VAEFAPAVEGNFNANFDVASHAPSSPDSVTLRGSNDVLFADGFEAP